MFHMQSYTAASEKYAPKSKNKNLANPYNRLVPQ